MAISLNTNLLRPSARAFVANGDDTGAPSISPPTFMPPTPSPTPAPPIPVASPVLSNLAMSPEIAITPPVVRPPIFTMPPFIFPTVLPQQPKTATQFAQGAIAQLNNVNPAAVTEAVNAARSRGLDGPGLMIYLERKTPIRAVMEAMAKDWADTTRNDFADAFQMAHDRFDAMDSIVSIAILNDRDLEAEVIAENTPQTTPNDLMSNRTVVWQYPPAGTQLQPPYVILVAVEYRNVATAEQVLNSINSQLGTFQGFKLPKTVIAKLG